MDSHFNEQDKQVKNKQTYESRLMCLPVILKSNLSHRPVRNPENFIVNIARIRKISATVLNSS